MESPTARGSQSLLREFPAGLIAVDEDYIREDLARRQKGYGRGGRMKIEKDRALIKSGVRHGVTLGSPIGMWVQNQGLGELARSDGRRGR